MSEDLNQFHAELPDEQYQDGFADTLAKQSYEFTLKHAMDRIDKLERERDEARRLAEEWKECALSRSADTPDPILLPWEKP